MRLRALLLLPLLLGVAQCSRQDDAGPEEDLPVAILHTAERQYTVHLGPDGSLYTVQDHSGRIIATRLSKSELVARHPELNSDLESLYAGNQILDSPFKTEPSPKSEFFEPKIPSPVEIEIKLPPLPDLRKPTEP